MLALNLLPWRETLRKTRNIQFFAAFGGALLVSGMLVIVCDGWINHSIGIQQANIDYLNQEILGIEPQILEIQGLQDAKARLIERRDIIVALQMERPVVVNLLTMLPKVLPESVYLTRLQRRLEKTAHADQKKQYRVIVEGVGVTNGSISMFLQKLQAVTEVRHAKLNEVTIHKKTTADLNFTLEFVQSIRGME